MKGTAGEGVLGLERTLAAVLEIMSGCRESWCVFGGATALIRGLRDDPLHDVDVLAQEGDARDIGTRLGRTSLGDGGNGRFHSDVFLRLETADMPIEIMAGLAVNRNGVWERVGFPAIEVLTWRGIVVPVPTWEGMRRLHLELGRTKDIELVALIA